MKLFKSLLFGIAVLAMSASYANADVVVLSNAIADIQTIPAGAQDRSELIFGDANGRRNAVIRFDTAAYAAALADPTEVLVGAELLLTEQAGRDGNNGDQSRSIRAFFIDGTSAGWDPATVGAANFTDPGNVAFVQTTTNGGPWAGNSVARVGNFGGGAGPTNVHNLADTGGANFGAAFGALTFASGSADSVAIDLTNGSGVTFSEVETILAEWATGIASNGGISIDSASAGTGANGDGLGQIFFQSVGSGSNQAGEAGNGAGGAQLRLTFVTVVPEPSSLVFLGLGSVLVGFRRRRS